MQYSKTGRRWRELLLRNIVSLCKRQGICIANLEKAVGLGNGTIRGWAKSSPRIDAVKKVADFFGVSVDSLISESGE